MGASVATSVVVSTTKSNKKESLEGKRSVESNVILNGNLHVIRDASNNKDNTNNGTNNDNGNNIAELAFRESLQHNPHNIKAMLGLATLHR